MFLGDPQRSVRVQLLCQSMGHVNGGTKIDAHPRFDVKHDDLDDEDLSSRRTQAVQPFKVVGSRLIGWGCQQYKDDETFASSSCNIPVV